MAAIAQSSLRRREDGRSAGTSACASGLAGGASTAGMDGCSCMELIARSGKKRPAKGAAGRVQI